MPKPRPLTPAQARHTLANRFGPKVDRLRQLATKFGVRSDRCFLVWTKWTGLERGEGDEVIAQRIEILPTPRVSSLDNVTFSPFHGGTLPVGSIRVDKISVTFTLDMLTGNMLPTPHNDKIPEPYEFFYEIVEDGRGDNPAIRAKYRLLNTPFRRPGKVDWTIMLERMSEDRTRDDKSAIGLGTEG